MRRIMGPGSEQSEGSKKNRFKKGVTNNPAGRPKGSRNRLSEAVLRDMLADWEAHGTEAIETFRTERPHEYVKVMAGLLPRNFNLKVNEYDELSDEQIHFQLRAVLGELAAAGVELGEGREATEGQEPPRMLSTLQ